MSCGGALIYPSRTPCINNLDHVLTTGIESITSALILNVPGTYYYDMYCLVESNFGTYSQNSGERPPQGLGTFLILMARIDIITWISDWKYPHNPIIITSFLNMKCLQRTVYNGSRVLLQERGGGWGRFQS